MLGVPGIDHAVSTDAAAKATAVPLISILNLFVADAPLSKFIPISKSSPAA